MQLSNNQLEDVVLALGIPENGGDLEVATAYKDYSSLLMIALDSPLNNLHNYSTNHFCSSLDKDPSECGSYPYRSINLGMVDITSVSGSLSSVEFVRELLEPDPVNKKLLKIKSNYEYYSKYSKMGIRTLGNLFTTVNTRIPRDISENNLRTYHILTSNPSHLNCYAIGTDAANLWSEQLGFGMVGVRRLVADMFNITYDPSTIGAPLPLLVMECLDLQQYQKTRFSNTYAGTLERACYSQVVNAIYHLMNSRLALRIPEVTFDSHKTTGVPSMYFKENCFKTNMFRSRIAKGQHIGPDGVTLCPYDMHTLHLFLNWSKNVAVVFGPNFSEVNAVDDYVFNPLFTEVDSLNLSSQTVPQEYSSLFPTLWVDKNTKKIVIKDAALIYKYSGARGYLSRTGDNYSDASRMSSLVEESKDQTLSYTRSKLPSYISSVATWLYKSSRDCLEFPEAYIYPKRSYAAKEFYTRLQYSKSLNMRAFRKVLATGLYHILNESFRHNVGGRSIPFYEVFSVLYRANSPKFHSNLFTNINDMDPTRLYVPDLDKASVQLAFEDLEAKCSMLITTYDLEELKVYSSNTEEGESLRSLYTRGLTTILSSVESSLRSDRLQFINAMGNVEDVLSVTTYSPLEFRILETKVVDRGITGLSIFSSTYVPKHLKIYSFITDTLRVPVSVAVLPSSIKLHKFFKICEVLERYDLALSVLNILETLMLGLLGSELSFQQRHCILGTVSRLESYAGLLTDLKDQD